jgi:hypothetical protein
MGPSIFACLSVYLYVCRTFNHIVTAVNLEHTVVTMTLDTTVAFVTPMVALLTSPLEF